MSGAITLGFQGPERLRVAKKIGHADQQVPEQVLDLLGVLAQKAEVVGDLVEMVQPHAPLDAAGEHFLAVAAKIKLRVGAQQVQ